MTHHDYIIADIRIRCNEDLVALGIRGFRPFEANTEGTPIVEIIIDRNDTVVVEGVELATSYLADANADSRFIRTANGYAYEAKRRDGKSPKALFEIDRTNNKAMCHIALQDAIDISLLRFGIWVIFGVVIAPLRGIAIHSSAIAYDARAVLFLGESGTGKSTHTRLWCENIENTELLNDDSPIIRIVDGELRAYGSPWSGKRPCYINRNHPVAGFVRLSQAPYNEIKTLGAISSIGALLPSCPHIFAADDYLQDEICTTIDQIIGCTPIYSMKCLPNAEAARLSHSTIFDQWATAL